MVGGGNLYHKVRRGREIIVQEERLNLYSCPMEPLMLTISITLLTKALLLISITWYKLQGLQNDNCMQQCHNKPHVRLHVVTPAHRALLPSAAYAHGATNAYLLCWELMWGWWLQSMVVTPMQNFTRTSKRFLHLNLHTNSKHAPINDSKWRILYAKQSTPHQDCCWIKGVRTVLLTLKGQCKPHRLGIILGESCSKLLHHCTRWEF